MKKLATLIMIFTIYSSTALRAEDVREEKSIEQMLGALKMEKIQAEMMIESMAKRGKLDHEEASRAKRAIASVKEDDVKDVQAEAMERLSSTKSFATK